MDPAPFCKIISVSGRIDGLEGKIALGVTLGPLGVLDDHVGKGKLLSGKSVCLCFAVKVFGLKPGFRVIGKVAFGIGKDIGQVDHAAGNGISILLQGIYPFRKFEMGGIVMLRSCG